VTELERHYNSVFPIPLLTVGFSGQLCTSPLIRKAYGIGLCSVEELGSLSRNSTPASGHPPSANHSSNGSTNGQPRLRDQLCLLIRQHNLDPTLVKAYAADFCGTPSLKEANRDLVQSFVSHLTACVKENRDMLICRLNSYAQPVEVKA
jgi:hypothetical protein